MGTNSKATHAHYGVAPTATGAAPIEADESSSYEQHLADVCNHSADPDGDAELALAKVAVIVHGGNDPGDPFGQPAVDLPDDPAEHYAIFAKAVAEALAAEDTLDGDAAAAYHHQLQLLAAEYFEVMEPDDLEKVAAAIGFEFPQLVGIFGKQPHPLAHWLDPTYPPHAESKATIQSLAQNRYAALCAGESVGGMSLAEWQQAAPGLPAHVTTTLPEGFESWHATESGLASARSALALTAGIVANHQDDLDPDNVATLIARENRIATAHNPALAADLATAVAAARHQVDQLLTHVTASDLSTAVEIAKYQGKISDTLPQVLDTQQTLQLLRASTPPAERTHLEALAAQRSAQLADLAASAAEVKKILGDFPGSLPGLDHPGSPAVLGSLVQDLHTMAAVNADAATWNTVEPPFVQYMVLANAQSDVLAWAQKQKLPDLRMFATDLGLLTSSQASVATKAALTQLFQHHTNAADTAVVGLKAQLQGKFDAKHQPKPAATPEVKSPPTVAKPPPVVLQPRSRFGMQHAQLVAALRQAQAAHAAVPKLLDPATVSAWDFGPGKPAQLGGIHPKTLHTGPDGTTWIAKGEGTPRGGAVTQAEAAASRMLARAGLPSVPVYATKVNGKPVSVQPMVTGATPMSSSPSTWTQAEVDAIVRLHVTSWAMGNHDAHSGNVLRTKDGGLMPIDQGQSFKYYGQDKLSLGYRPNNDVSVHHRAYDAHLAGKLAKGVQVNPAVAHSVIKQLESVPDAEWRAMLHTAAHTGAAQKEMKWVPAMRARAAKQHGIAESAVTTTQIADAFLDFAVDRKKNLRRDFTSFFTHELKIPAAAALQHLGKT